MIEETTAALIDFTRHYYESWQRECGHPPASRELYGIPSPCVQENDDGRVIWLPQPFTLAKNLDAVERALALRIQPSVVAWYTTQFAGDMHTAVDGQMCTLLQTWSEDDFVRLQENLIGHLIMQRRLKLSPTLFIATTCSEQEIISVCNLTGEVILEQSGSKKRRVLADNLIDFLSILRDSIRFAENSG
ncbi:SecY-interacting protein [Erwinia psidii]|uniref:Protein Syd n=1 Tax=Erwinia psidii TaxID=69224 RepID=A0A3N6V4X2_9GAMM|nr:SecY-interacting protein [Erwinia psidii]MCX8956856.1 SecY-interacting protein [Erwinia psidii]MCX8960333.1 SecY-interacting protein [Erwinia psidii]MCX8964487.1 SecY-interacting protein [Erwinia psidii]RQM40175.1 SecY-interacting protein [Erwinia psidii]